MSAMSVPEGENSLKHLHLSEILAGHVQIAEGKPIHTDRQKETYKAKHHPNQYLQLRDLPYHASAKLIIIHHAEYLELQCENTTVRAEENESLEISSAHAVVSIGAVMVLSLAQKYHSHDTLAGMAMRHAGRLILLVLLLTLLAFSIERVVVLEL